LGFRQNPRVLCNVRLGGRYTTIMVGEAGGTYRISAVLGPPGDGDDRASPPPGCDARCPRASAGRHAADSTTRPMTQPRRPRTLLFLLLFLLWIDAKTLGTVVFPSTSASYHVFVGLGLAWVHFVLAAVTIALAATATGYLWRPEPGWINAVLVALGFYAVQTVVEAALMVRHLPAARAAWVAGRQARGLPLHPDRIDQVFSPDVLWRGAGAMVVFLAVLAVAGWRRRDFAYPQEAE